LLISSIAIKVTPACKLASEVGSLSRHGLKIPFQPGAYFRRAP